MVYVCFVKGCINSYKYTAKKCKLFKFPKDEFMSVQIISWSACTKTQKKKVLLPYAVPTDFTMIPKEDSYNSTTCLNTNISDPIFNASVSTSTPLKQKESFSSACSTSQSSSHSANQSISSSTQTTQYLTLHTPRKQKYRAQLQAIKNKYEQLEQKFEALSQEVHKKNCANEIDVTSVDLFNRVVEAQLPPNLGMVIKQYVKMGKRKPQGMQYSKLNKDMLSTRRKHRKLVILFHL